MKIQKRSNSEERTILTAMIVDPIVLGRISSKYQGGMFKSRWANIISKWCINYFRKYDESPMNQIEGLFESWSAKTKDENAVSLVGDFLDGLSDDYENLSEESNSKYIIDRAGEYFNRVKVEKLIDQIQGDIDNGEIQDAIGHATSFNPTEMGVGEGINLLQDKEAIKRALSKKTEPIIQYSGDLGRFLQNSLERDAFVGFMGPAGVGKSFWLQDIAFRAMLQRKRVVFFEAGDSSEEQVMRRFIQRISRRPILPGSFTYPTSISRESKEDALVELDSRHYKKRISCKETIEACKFLMKKRIRSKEPYFRLSCHYNSTLTVSIIKDIVQNWAREGWVPDVIVIDYADILNMEYQGLEGRDRINETWKRLRSLSQLLHCLVVTATQTNAASYSTKVITRKNFSDDRRKIDQVTGMIGLNQTPEEKGVGVVRLNWVKLRDGIFNEYRCVHVAGCLAVSNPAIKSTF